jgi:hypothetical protein
MDLFLGCGERQPLDATWGRDVLEVLGTQQELHSRSGLYSGLETEHETCVSKPQAWRRHVPIREPIGGDAGGVQV